MEKKLRYLTEIRTSYIHPWLSLLLLLMAVSCGAESREGQFYVSNSTEVAARNGVLVCQLTTDEIYEAVLRNRYVSSAWVEYRHRIGHSMVDFVIDSTKKVLVLKVEENINQLFEELKGSDNGSVGLYSGSRIYLNNITDEQGYKITLQHENKPLVIEFFCN
ncbi:MAG: hypothetical protein AAF433_15000 [Bacteroidota bacterium]